MTTTSGRPIDVAICDVRAFDRTALAAVCTTDPRFRVVLSTDDTAQLLAARTTSHDRLVVLIGSRVVRESGADLIDQLHNATPRPYVLLVGLDEHSLPALALRAHADGYLDRAADITDQIVRIAQSHLNDSEEPDPGDTTPAREPRPT